MYQSLLDQSISQSGRLMPLRFRTYLRKDEVYLCTPPLLFCRPPPQPNCLAHTSDAGASGAYPAPGDYLVSEWYFIAADSY